jgi:hypothetical protein
VLRFFLVGVALVLAATAFSQSAKQQSTARINPTTVSLLEQAKKFMKFTGEVEMPTIISSSQDDLKQMYCPGRNCSVSAIYESGTIYLDNDIDFNNSLDKSIILHELVHHVQWIKYGSTLDCQRWFANEREAYKIQAKYLKSKKIDPFFITDTVTNLKCPE